MENKKVAELTIEAFKDGTVSLVVPGDFNLWVMRGILAKALETANGIQLSEKDKEPEEKIPDA